MARMSLRLPCAALVILASCGGGAETPDAGPPRPVLEGGTIALPAPCGYAVTTRVGAEAPTLAAADAPLGTDGTPRQLHLGLGSADAAHGMVVSWRTTDETTLATTVQYGKAAVTENSAQGLTFAYMTGFGADGPLVRLHETHLCGLEPDTQYVYRVGGEGADGPGGDDAWSPTYSFRTAPDPVTQPDAEVVVLVLGDTRDGYALWGGLLQTALAAASPDLILFTGDAVTLGPVQDEWDQWFDMAEPVIRQVPLVSAHGNHDVNAINFYGMLALPGDEVFFGLDYGPLHLTVMNDSPPEIGDLEGRGRDFLDADLTAHAAAPWKMVMHHRAMWSACTNHGSDVTLRGIWGPVIDAHHVDMVLAGHDHNYERTLPMKGDLVAASPAEGTVFLVAGGGGAALYTNGTDFWTAYSEKTQNFTVLRLRAGTLQLDAYRDDGTMIDTFAISKP